MAEKVKRSEKNGPGGAGEDLGKNSRGANPRVWLGLVAAVAVMVTLSVYSCRQHTLSQQMEAGLPARPASTARPAILGELLATAEAKARASTTTLEGTKELGRLYHANGFNAEAEACWRLLRTLQPGEPRWCYYLADLRRADGDDAEMTALLRQTLALAPDYSPAWLLLANLELKTGDFDGAERDYRRRLAQQPRDPYARLGLVRLALQKGQSDEAGTLLEELLKDAPNFSTAHNLYAGILAAAGDEAGAQWHRWLGVETIRYAEAEDPWLDELQAWCYDYSRLCVLGSIEFQREKLDRAKALYERAIQLDPGAMDAYQLLSVIYFKQNEPARVRDLLEQAQPRLGTANRATWFTYLCRAYRLLKQPAEAERVARQGLARMGETAELLEALGLALADSERQAEAVQAYRAAGDRNPNDASINYNLAVSLLALRRLDEALEALDRSLILQPAFPPTLVLRGRIEMAAGHWVKAEEYLRPVFESHPDNVEARGLLVEWHRHMGAEAERNNEPAAAERHYRDGLAIDPNNAELLLSLGIFHLAHGGFAHAVEPLESYHRLHPENAQGCLFLGQAYAGTGRREDAREVLNRGVQLAQAAGNSRTASFCRDLLRDLGGNTD